MRTSSCGLRCATRHTRRNPPAELSGLRFRLRQATYPLRGKLRIGECGSDRRQCLSERRSSTNVPLRARCGPPVARNVVLRWENAFNARDLARMLVCVLSRMSVFTCSGRAAWWLLLPARRAWGSVRQVWGACVTTPGSSSRKRATLGMAECSPAGSLSLAGEFDVGAFCAVHRIAGGGERLRPLSRQHGRSRPSERP